VLEAGIRLPAGASITKVEVQACDTNASVNGGLSLCAKSNSSGVCTALETVTINANTGCALTTLSLTPAHTVNNAVNSYYLSWSNFPALDGTIKIQAARVYYKLQISPDPTTATFTDVPVGHPFHRFVEALVAAGITGGCGGGNYCPDAPVTRGQMAVFLSAALGLHWAP
jgi:S-layer family protein